MESSVEGDGSVGVGVERSSAGAGVGFCDGFPGGTARDEAGAVEHGGVGVFLVGWVTWVCGELFRCSPRYFGVVWGK